MANVATTRVAGRHGSARSYNLGFALSAGLTVIPFLLVMNQVLPRPATLLTLVLFAIAQLIVQLVYFLHMSRSSEGGWNLMSFAFTVLILLIIVALSIWIIWSMHYHMMID